MRKKSLIRSATFFSIGLKNKPQISTADQDMAKQGGILQHYVWQEKIGATFL